MGCFLACFGSSKSRNPRNRRNRVLPRHPVSHLHREGSYKGIESTQCLNQENKSNEPIDPVTEIRDKPKEQVSLIVRKKVTFDSNVKTYDHIPVDEEAEYLPESKQKGEYLAKLSEPHLPSSHGTYPLNHRYGNCMNSDDEGEELEYDVSDLDDDEDDEDESGDEDYEDYNEDYAKRRTTHEVDSRMISRNTGVSVEESETLGSNHDARNRNMDVHSVLNPVENLTQWKAAKAIGKLISKQSKENFTYDQEPELSLSYKAKFDEPKKRNQEIAVDASLSNWLGSSETTPIDTASRGPIDTASRRSNSLRSYEDRPILGALTVDEIKQFSASSSPRKSPSRSPNEMPIIGSVGRELLES